jgi:hypothetical protein
MAREHTVIFEHDLRVPTDAFTFEGFQGWVESEDFPAAGRIDLGKPSRRLCRARPQTVAGGTAEARGRGWPRM